MKTHKDSDILSEEGCRLMLIGINVDTLRGLLRDTSSEVRLDVFARLCAGYCVGCGKKITDTPHECPASEQRFRFQDAHGNPMPSPPPSTTPNPDWVSVPYESFGTLIYNAPFEERLADLKRTIESAQQFLPFAPTRPCTYNDDGEFALGNWIIRPRFK